MNAIYLSGTGNTKHITELLFSEIGAKGNIVPIESPDVNDALKDDELIISYPTMFSNIPYLVRDFINKHEWQPKIRLPLFLQDFASPIPCFAYIESGNYAGAGFIIFADFRDKFVDSVICNNADCASAEACSCHS